MKKIMMAALAVSVAGTAIVPDVTFARHRDRDRVYRGNSERYEYRCKESSGTTGLVAGGAGGALLGHAVGGGTLGTIAGGVGGALLGKHLDKKHDSAQNRRNGC